MSDIINDLTSLRKLNSASASAIIDITNENFAKISNAVYTFLTNIQYDESAESMTLSDMNAAVITVNNSLKMLVNGNEMFSVDQNGRVWSKSYVAKDIVQSERLRLSLFTGAPNTTIGGDIIYGQVYTDPAQTTLSPLDFWGYIQNQGWYSLTGYSGSGFIPTTTAMWCGQVASIPRRLARS